MRNIITYYNSQVYTKIYYFYAKSTNIIHFIISGLHKKSNIAQLSYKK